MPSVDTKGYNPDAEPWTPPWKVTEDLHLHTTASDGKLDPEALVQLTHRNGLRVAAVTDHDTVGGVERALKAGADLEGLAVIPGIEVSSHTPDSEAHVLGLFVDHRSPELLEILDGFAKRREETIAMSVERLAELGKPVRLERVHELAQGTVGRPHIARAMVEEGHVSSFREAFDLFLGAGKPAYIKRPGIPPRRAVEIIHAARGVAVLAHPRTVDGLDDVLQELVDAGLDGMEVYAERYLLDMQQAYIRMADRHGLVYCGGSDFHANGNKHELQPGMTGPPPGTALKMYRRAMERHGGKPGFTMPEGALEGTGQ